MLIATVLLAITAWLHPKSAVSFQFPTKTSLLRSRVQALKAVRQNRFDGKIALVTGGSSGIGEAVVRGLVDEGAIVVVGDVVDDEGKPLAETSKSVSRADEVTSFGKTAHLIRLDVRSRVDWKDAIAYCETLGGVDILINNAGVIEFGSIEEGDMCTFKHVIDINQCGAFYGMSTAATALKARKGCIINVSSITGLRGYKGIAAYVASNWALRGMTKSAALEFARDGVRVNSIHAGPHGPIDTHHSASPMKAGVDIGELVANQPMDRIGTPKEIAHAVLFLASDDASYITGAEIAVDGGASLGPIQEVHAYASTMDKVEVSQSRSDPIVFDREW